MLKKTKSKSKIYMHCDTLLGIKEPGDITFSKLSGDKSALKEKINEYTKNNNEYTVNIDFYDDSKYEMVWILCKINKKLKNS